MSERQTADNDAPRCTCPPADAPGHRDALGYQIARETCQKNGHGIPSKKNPPWWPTAEQKLHADAGCAHPDECRVIPPAKGDDQ